MKTRPLSGVAFALQILLLGGAVSHADELADAKQAAQTLGLSLPDKILRRPAVAKELGALARERCDREAVYEDLADKTAPGEISGDCLASAALSG